MIKFKKGMKVYTRVVGFGFTAYEEVTVERASRDARVFIEGTPYDAATGFRIDDGAPADSGITTALVISPDEFEKAAAYCAQAGRDAEETTRKRKRKPRY